MSKKTLTKWEAGQVLIKAQDFLFECQKDLRDNGYAKLANFLTDHGLEIGDEFNALKSHDFGLAGTKDSSRKKKQT